MGEDRRKKAGKEGSDKKSAGQEAGQREDGGRLGSLCPEVLGEEQGALAGH